MPKLMEKSETREQSKSPDLVIERTFDAPRELVWRAWTDPRLTMQWWGPEHFTCPVSRIDLRKDGTYLLCMRSPDGKDFWSTGRYLEIVPLERIVMTDSFADGEGNVVAATHYGMSPDFPMELKVTLTFENVPGGTRFRLRHEGMPVSDLDNAMSGWSTSIDKLERVLKANRSMN
jgi:uncharacterized protein YndB with AHSA1/START domain